MAISALPDILDEYADLIHPAALLLPRPTATEYNDLKLSVQERGVLQPLATFVDTKGDHWLLDGVTRLQIMAELGMTIIDEGTNQWAMPTTPFYEEQGHDPYEVALSLNLARRHLTPEQKREVIGDLMAQRPDLSDRAIARMAGASPHTVGSVRHQQEEEAPVEEEDDEIEAAEEDDDEQSDRVEETGRRARGQRQLTREEREERRQPTSDEPFVGTVSPSSAKSTRVAEARRCVKHLRLEVDDLLPRSRRETMH